MREPKTRTLVVLLLTFFLSTCAIKHYQHWSIRNQPSVPIEDMPDRRGQDKIIVRFGKQNMAYYTGGMSANFSEDDLRRFEGDRVSKIYFDAQLREDGTIWLVNMRYDPMSFETCCYNNHLTVRLESSTWYQHGQQINDMYKTALDSTHLYSVRDGDLYGLDRYVEYRKKDNERSSRHEEYLVTMKQDGTPLRFLAVVSPDIVREIGGGGVSHYFMYNDDVQVKMHYRKYILQDWQAIENSMRAYINQLYKDAEQ